MSDKLSMDDIAREREALLALAAEYENVRDADEMIALNEKIAEASARLNDVAHGLAAQIQDEMDERYGEGSVASPSHHAVVEVELTEAQQRRVKEETDVDLTTVLLDDNLGLRSQMMPYTPPELIEALAIEAARKMKASADAAVAAKEAVDAALGDFEKDASPEALELLEKAKEDPNFLAGALQNNDED